MKQRSAAEVGAGWRVPFMRPDLPVFDDVITDFQRAFVGGSLTKGECLRRFEEEAREACGSTEMVGVSSCTSGLMLVMGALATLAERRVDGCAAYCGFSLSRSPSPDRDEVIVPSFIFLAAPAAIVWAGFRPVFVDVDPATFTVDPAAVERAISHRTAAILACHTFGCPCDMDTLRAIAERSGVPLVVDAAHGLGTAVDGRQVGAQGLAQVFSLSPTKLVVAGEGGLVATSCSCLAEAIRVGREYGNDGNYGCARAGMNARMPELSAAVGRASLARLPQVAARRREAAAAYTHVLREVSGISFQEIPAAAVSSWKDFCVAVDPTAASLSRDELRAGLARRGIDTRAYYSPACHRMAAFQQFAHADHELPVTDRLADSLLALPMGGHVTASVAGEIGEEICSLVAAAKRTVQA